MNKLSVVVPVYNVEKYLRRCLDSVVKQTYKNTEIILVNDGSTDSSETICVEYVRAYDNVRLISQENQGLSGARNTGIDNASGDFITFVDSDDYIDLNMYSELMQLMEKKSADICIGGVWTEKENGEKYTAVRKEVIKTFNKKEALVELNSYNYFNMSFCDKIFKANLFSGLRFPLGKLCEDYYLMHRVIAKADVISYTSKPYYHYIQRYNSISRSRKINMAPLDASVQQLKFYQENFPDLAYAAETACAFSHMGIYTSHLRNDVECPKELLDSLRKTAVKYLKSVLKNPHIPKIKKIQALSFCYVLPVYRYVIKRSKHR